MQDKSISIRKHRKVPPSPCKAQRDCRVHLLSFITIFNIHTEHKEGGRKERRGKTHERYLPKFGHQLISRPRNRQTPARREHTKRARIATIPHDVINEAGAHFVRGVFVQVFTDFLDPWLEVPKETGRKSSEHRFGRPREGGEGEGARAFLNGLPVAAGELGGVGLEGGMGGRKEKRNNGQHCTHSHFRL